MSQSLFAVQIVLQPQRGPGRSQAGGEDAGRQSCCQIPYSVSGILNSVKVRRLTGPVPGVVPVFHSRRPINLQSLKAGLTAETAPVDLIRTPMTAMAPSRVF